METSSQPAEAGGGNIPVGAAVLRDATLADLPAIVKMAVRFAKDSEYATYFTDADELIAMRFQQRARELIEKDGCILYVVERNGTLAGMAGGLASSHPLIGTKTFFEVMLWVEPEYRKSRVFLMLMAALEHTARESGCQLLLVGSPNNIFTATLSRLGYNPAELSLVKKL